MSSLPNWLGQAPPFPIVLPTTGSTAVTAGNGGTTIVSVSLPAGTYLVGGNFYIQSTTTFTNTDRIDFIINGGALLYPQTTLTGYSQTGSSPADIVATVTGVVILTDDSNDLLWSVDCSFTLATGKTAYVTNPFYQRIA